MRSITLGFLAALILVAPLMANEGSDARQLVNVRVNNGYHLGTMITLKGEVDLQGSAMPKTTVFINQFSTRVNPEGQWALCFPKRSLYPDKRGTVVKVRAVQEDTNIIVKTEFDLASLNEVMDREIKFEELFEESK